MSILRPAALLVAATLSIGCLACGGGADGGTNCNVTLSGAVTDSLNCTATATRETSTGVATVVIAVPNSQGPGSIFVFRLELGQGAPAASTYTATNSGKSGAAYGACTSRCWVEFFKQTDGAGGALPDMGSFSLTITSVGPASVGASSTTYPVQGTADLVLVPGIGGGASLKAHAAF